MVKSEACDLGRLQVYLLNVSFDMSHQNKKQKKVLPAAAKRCGNEKTCTDQRRI